jgi:hypothetical protein
VSEARPPRSNYLQHTEQRLLIDWMKTLTRMFNANPDVHVTPYLVGSVTSRPDWRDVDVRVMLPDEVMATLPIDVRWLNLCISLWGQKVTGLPIDCQVESVTDGNKYDGHRHPLGISSHG